jgi:hypothetical protein
VLRKRESIGECTNVIHRSCLPYEAGGTFRVNGVKQSSVMLVQAGSGMTCRCGERRLNLGGRSRLCLDLHEFMIQGVHMARTGASCLMCVPTKTGTAQTSPPSSMRMRAPPPCFRPINLLSGNQDQRAELVECVLSSQTPDICSACVMPSLDPRTSIYPDMVSAARQSSARRGWPAAATQVAACRVRLAPALGRFTSQGTILGPCIIQTLWFASSTASRSRRSAHEARTPDPCSSSSRHSTWPWRRCRAQPP